MKRIISGATDAMLLLVLWLSGVALIAAITVWLIPASAQLVVWLTATAIWGCVLVGWVASI